jgi:hypothetical protein
MQKLLRDRRSWAVITLVAAITFTTTSTLQADPPNRAFSVAISPATATINQTQSYTITITNVGSGGGASANLGSAEIQIPAGFTGVSITNVTPTPPQWTGEVVGAEIRLTAGTGHDTFGSGDSVAVTFSATAPGTPGGYEWTTTLHKNANFHGPTPALSGTQPVVTVQDVTPPPPPPPLGGSIQGAKFYDTNTNGEWDEDEPGIEGWKVHLVGDGVDQYAFTDSDGLFTFEDLEPGDYVVSEVFPPAPPTWIATTEDSFDASVEEGQNYVGPDFGNVCIGCNGGGHTLGYWSNKNGSKTFADRIGTATALAALTALNLVDADGNPFDPPSYAAFRPWLLSATATNMAYMLSAQLAAMQLNVLADVAGIDGFVDSGALVYAPNVAGANPAGFISIADLMAAADNQLESNPYTPAGNPNRDEQETIKDALDDANNNDNFVCPEPCPVVYPIVVAL